MKIAIVGYGRMGHEVEKAAAMQGHELVCHIDVDNRQDFDSQAFLTADAAIEFSRPDAAFANVTACLTRGIPTVSGTTGWSDRFAEIDALVAAKGVPMVWASNYSIGVNIFMMINRYAARLLGRTGLYTPSMEEVHHIHKLDHPSGTAITLAEGILAEDKRYTGWHDTLDTDKVEVADGLTLPITPRREGEVPGTHIIRWDSMADTITLEHRAKGRLGFAMGAVSAAEWLTAEHREPKRYSMSEVLKSELEND